MADHDLSPPVLSIAIVADDLTGCCDAAAPFAGRGVSVNVCCTPSAVLSGNAGVVAYCTDSRHDPAVEAARKVEAVCRSLTAATGSRRRFKKIDSTLKGNLGAEVESMLNNGPSTIAVICPAFPAQGRVLEDGYLRVRGQTAAIGHLPSILSSQSSLPLRHFSIDATSDLLSTRSLETDAPQPALWVLDAADARDLARVATVIDRLGSIALAVGSSGLARLLAQQWIPLPPSAVHHDTQIVRMTDLVAVIGTQNRVTVEQLDHLRRVQGGMVIDGGVPTKAVVRDRSEQPIVFRHVWNTASDQSLALFFDQLKVRRAGTLLVTGGDTAQRCCQLTNTETIAIDGEFEPGVPWGRILDGTLKGWQIATKAGGFGAPDTLSRVWARVQPSNSADPSSPPSVQ